MGGKRRSSTRKRERKRERKIERDGAKEDREKKIEFAGEDERGKIAEIAELDRLPDDR